MTELYIKIMARNCTPENCQVYGRVKKTKNNVNENGEIFMRESILAAIEITSLGEVKEKV